MPKKPENHGKPWTDKQVQQLEKLVDQNTPTRVIGLKLGRKTRSDPRRAKMTSRLSRQINHLTTNARNEALKEVAWTTISDISDLPT